MNKILQNQTIATILGWEYIEWTRGQQKFGVWVSPEMTFNRDNPDYEYNHFVYWVPNYESDLNLCYQLEEHLIKLGKNYWSIYLDELELCGDPVHAKAHFKTKAFLRTLGKYSEAPEKTK